MSHFSASLAISPLSNYSSSTKMPVASTARRYSSTSGTTSYRTTGTTDRPYLGSTTSDFTSVSRLHTEHRPRHTLRSSTSVPTSYSKKTDFHESTRSIRKDRSEANDTSFLSLRSKTENDVSLTYDKYDKNRYKFRSSFEGRFQNLSSNLWDYKYSSSQKHTNGMSLDPARIESHTESSKTVDHLLRLPRKDSLTKSDTHTDTSPSPTRSLERKSSSSVTGGSSSPIEIRKPSKVWNNRLSGSYDGAIKGCFENDLSIDNENQAKLASRENSDDLSESSIILENIESEEKTLSFEEILRKFDNNDSNDMKGGYESSSQKSSHSKESKISNGVILDFPYQYIDRNSKMKKLVDNSVDEADVEAIDIYKLDTNNSFLSSQPLQGSLLKRFPSNLKNHSNNSTNISGNNNIPAYTNLRKSPDPIPDVSNNAKKNSLPELNKAVPSPDKKEASPSGMNRLLNMQSNETMHKIDDGIGKGGSEAKREARKFLISSTLGMDNKNDLMKTQTKRKGEKTTKSEQTLAKPLEQETEIFPRLRRSPETKPKDFAAELREIDSFPKSTLESGSKSKDTDVKEKKVFTIQKPTIEKSPQKTKINEKIVKTSPVKDVGKTAKEETASSPGAVRKELVKAKKSTSLKDEKETSNARERELNKRLFNDETAEMKLSKKAEDKSEAEAAVKEASPMDKTDLSKNFNGRTLPGPSAYQNPNSCSSNESLENAGIHGTSPRLNVGWSKNSNIEKGGLNGLRNIGNTCFMNSVIQCLSNTKPLLEYLLNEDYLSDINTTISGMKGALIKDFSNVIQELWAPNAEDKIINTINFKSQIQRFAPRFMGYSQQDAQEFLRYLLEGLHEDVNRVTAKPKPITTDIDDTLSDNQKAAEAWKRYLRMDDSKVVDIFVGQLKSTLQCTVCGHCSVTFDPFWDLSLPVPNRNGQLRLSSCLDAFTKEEVLDGDEKPTCSKCKTRRKCTKSFSIQKFPKILVLHLKRFSPTERYRGKLSVTVEFPLTNLDLSAYAANRGQSCTYNLYAISNHSGTAYSGHYTAYCKHPYTGNWHEYNDSGVSSLSSRSVVSGEAYVLFYELAAQTSHL